MRSRILKEIKKHKFVYGLLAVVLFAGFFVRIYRVDQILGFYFDQGRDALVIWDLWHNHKLFLIGPTTGLAGIFRGPYYYYLIAPFYLIGGGDPVWPAIFLAFTTVLAVGLIYYLGYQIQNRETGIIAAIIAAFSFYIVLASQWLSNPTPMLLLSMLLVWAMFQIVKNPKLKVQKYWVVIAGISGLSLFSFGSSGEFFYFPALLIFIIWQRKKLPTLKYLVISAIVFFLTFAPLLLFDFKHEHLLFNNFKSTFFGQKSFSLSFTEVLKARTAFYWDVFTSKIFEARKVRENILLLVVGISFLAFLPKFIKNDGVKILILMFFAPIVGLLFFQGNFGNIYDYYLTGYYLIFILLFAIVLGQIWKYKIGKIFVIYFMIVFLGSNLEIVRYKIIAGVDGPETIAYGNQKQALDWIYKNAQGNKFNVDEYVPPVIPYAYEYLLKWQNNPNLMSDQVPLLYTLYEVDPPHPERLDAWLKRQNGIGRVLESVKFGGITVEKRIRYTKS